MSGHTPREAQVSHTRERRPTSIVMGVSMGEARAAHLNFDLKVVALVGEAIRLRGERSVTPTSRDKRSRSLTVRSVCTKHSSRSMARQGFPASWGQLGVRRQRIRQDVRDLGGYRRQQPLDMGGSLTNSPAEQSVVCESRKVLGTAV